MARYIDDPTISDDAALWRRIPPWHFVFDKNRGRWRAASAAFENHPNGTPMSVLLATLMQRENRGPRQALGGLGDYALASITAGLVRRCEQGVAHEPLPDEPAHGVVFGNKTKSVRRRFAREAEWVIPPPETQSA